MRLCYQADWKLARFQSKLKASCMSSHTSELWYNETVCGWQYIYFPHPRSLRTLTKELAVATRIMQSSSNKLSTLISISIKCKQTEIFNTYTLNSFAYIETASGWKVVLSGWHKVGWVSIPAEGISRVWWVCHTRKQSVDNNIYIYFVSSARNKKQIDLTVI